MALVTRIRGFLKDPLIHFLFIGACIYGAYGVFGETGESNERPAVVVTREEIKSLTEQWTRLWNRPPTEAELADLLRKHVRTRILYQEAMALGLDKEDPVIERRLAQKVELLSRSLMVPDPPDDDVLAAWYAQNPDDFREPDIYTFTQVFFDPDSRGSQAPADAEAALAQLDSDQPIPENLSEIGDRSIFRNRYSGRTPLDIQRTFGAGFVDQLIRLEPGRWHGPLLSGFGVHLVYLQDIARSEQPALADVREQVQEAWMLAQIDERSTVFIDELIDRYDVVVEETRVPMTVPPDAGGQ